MDRKFTNTTVKVEPQPLPGGDRNPPSPWLVAVLIPITWTVISGLLVGVFSALLIYGVGEGLQRFLVPPLLIGPLAGVMAGLNGLKSRPALALAFVFALIVGVFIWLMLPWVAALAAAFSAMILMWIVKIEMVFQPMLEQITGRDLNNDGFVGGPPSPRTLIVQNQGQTGDFVEFPVEDNAALAFVAAVLAGSVSYRALSAKGLKDDEIESCWDELKLHGYCEKELSGQRRLTLAGRSGLAVWLEDKKAEMGID